MRILASHSVLKHVRRLGKNDLVAKYKMFSLRKGHIPAQHVSYRHDWSVLRCTYSALASL